MFQIDPHIMSYCPEGFMNIHPYVFCLLFGVSSDYAQPIASQVTDVVCPVIGRTQPELTLRKRQKTGPVDILTPKCGRPSARPLLFGYDLFQMSLAIPISIYHSEARWPHSACFGRIAVQMYASGILGSFMVYFTSIHLHCMSYLVWL